MIFWLKVFLVVLMYCFATCLREQLFLSSARSNICFSEKVPSLNITFGAAWTHGTYCGKPTYLKRHCCEGYGSVAGEKGCSVVSFVRTAIEQSHLLNVDAFLEDLLINNVFGYLSKHHRRAFTIVLVEDYKSYEAEKQGKDAPRETTGEHKIPNHLLNHVLPRRWYSQDFGGKNTVLTIRSASLIVSYLNRKLILLNCVPLQRLDIPCREGVIHTVPKPLPVSFGLTLSDLIARDGNLTTFLSIVGYADFLWYLRKEGAYTVFAPTNAAFEKFPQKFIDAITYDAKFSTALKALVQNHIVDEVLCSMELPTRGTVQTLLEKLSVKCNAFGPFRLRIGSAALLSSNHMASNGVLHYIDSVLLPSKALSLIQVARKLGAHIFVKIAKLTWYFQEMVSAGPFTIFVPTDTAFKSYLTSEDMTNSSQLVHILEFHMVRGKHIFGSFLDYDVLVSRTFQRKLRIRRTFSQMFTVENAIVLSPDNEAFNGVVHLIDKVLTPPDETIAGAIASLSNAQRFADLLRKDAITWRNLNTLEPYTVFVVLDHDIDRWAMDYFTYFRILEDLTMLSQVLENHIINNFILPDGLAENAHTVIKEKNGQTVMLSNYQTQLSLSFNSVKSNFIICSNGVVMFTDSLILP